MKKFVFLSAMVAVAMFAASCVQIRTNDSASAAITTKVEPIYYKAEVETGATQVTGTATLNTVRLFFIPPITWGDSNYADRTDLNCGASPSALSAILGDPIADVKKAAVYNACTKAQCDALAAAKYSVNIKDYVVFQQITCTVKGYPVVQKSIKRVDAPAK